MSIDRQSLLAAFKQVLLDFGRDIEYISNDLPEYMKNDPDIAQRRPCMEHYNQLSMTTHIDGPPPMIQDCLECKRGGRKQRSNSYIIDIQGFISATGQFLRKKLLWYL